MPESGAALPAVALRSVADGRLLSEWRLALRNIARHRVRTLMTLAAIAGGVAGLMLIGGFVEDVLLQLQEGTVRSGVGHLQVSRIGYRSEGRRDPYAFLVEDSGALASAIIDEERVTTVGRRLFFNGVAHTSRTARPVLAEGVEPQAEAELGGFLSFIEGRPLEAGDSYCVVLGEGLAKSLGLTSGGFLTLLVSSVGGGLNALDFEVVGIFRSISRDLDERALRMPLGVARELLLAEGVHALVVLLDETGATSEVRRRLQKLLSGKGLEVTEWRELADYYRQTRVFYRAQFVVLQIFLLLVVVLCIVNSVNLAVHERTGEFGLSRALGYPRNHLFRLLILEHFQLGLIGALAGALLGYGLSTLIAWKGIPMPPPPNANVEYIARVRLTPSAVLGAVSLGVLAPVLSALAPAGRAVRVPLPEALRRLV